LKARGVDRLINYRSEPNWGAAAQTQTGGREVDHLLEIGGAGTSPQSACASRVAAIGRLSGQDVSLTTMLMMGNQLRIT
jgi:NADPH:quinone reductase-like Zn-dependent oxidoreductase